MSLSPSEEREASWNIIGSEYREKISTQTYGAKAVIEGVRLLDLRLFSDEAGDFCELMRWNEDRPLTTISDFRPLQASYSMVMPGAVKAWHLHLFQEDLWFVPPADRLLVGLLDLRASSGSYQAHMRLVLGAGAAKLLLIPRGVAHGVANRSGQPASVIYFTSAVFDPVRPDERRLPYDLLGSDFWDIQSG